MPERTLPGGDTVSRSKNDELSPLTEPRSFPSFKKALIIDCAFMLASEGGKCITALFGVPLDNVLGD